ncbi:MAG: diaminopimelate decarboxylase, partial [Clostridiales Family XIII bacterium]|nr:diaminopimelate decarboxylase [Clostridiales Family XIII bacterium]
MDTENETLHIEDGMLHIDGMSAAELVARHGTPLYVLSRSALAKRIAELRTDVLDRYPNTRAAYASKAFLCIAMCEIIEEEGLALDVVSGGELYTAMKAGFPAERIEFHGNNKLPEELEMAIGYGVGRIIIDAPDELRIIEEIAARQGRKPSILFRINPEVEANTHTHISTGFKGSKFGFAPDGEQTLALLAAASASEHVDLLGIHCHVGSQLFDKDSHLGALATMLHTIKEARDQLG